MRLLVPILVLVVAVGFMTTTLLAASESNPAAPAFAALLALARHDMSTQKGGAYDAVMGQQFASKHGDTVRACVEASGHSAPESFQTVIVVEKDGKVSKVALNPETEVAKCLRKVFLRETFPRPPFAPYHDLIEMSFK